MAGLKESQFNPIARPEWQNDWYNEPDKRRHQQYPSADCLTLNTIAVFLMYDLLCWLLFLVLRLLIDVVLEQGLKRCLCYSTTINPNSSACCRTQPNNASAMFTCSGSSIRSIFVCFHSLLSRRHRISRCQTDSLPASFRTASPMYSFISLAISRLS